MIWSVFILVYLLCTDTCCTDVLDKYGSVGRSLAEGIQPGPGEEREERSSGDEF